MENGDMDRSARNTGLKVAAALGVLMIVLGGMAIAGTGKWHGAMFDRVDANDDGKISPEEVQPFANKRFARFDSDNNGVVTAAEIDAHLMKRMEKRRARLLKRFDDDGDGAISQAEFGNQVTQIFSRVDDNDDGAISRSEADKMRKHMRGHWKRHMGYGMDDETGDQSQEN